MAASSAEEDARITEAYRRFQGEADAVSRISGRDALPGDELVVTFLDHGTLRHEVIGAHYRVYAFLANAIAAIRRRGNTAVLHGAKYA